MEQSNLHKKVQKSIRIHTQIVSIQNHSHPYLSSSFSSSSSSSSSSSTSSFLLSSSSRSSPLQNERPTRSYPLLILLSFYYTLVPHLSSIYKSSYSYFHFSISSSSLMTFMSRFDKLQIYPCLFPGFSDFTFCI